MLLLFVWREKQGQGLHSGGEVGESTHANEKKEEKFCPAVLVVPLGKQRERRDLQSSKLKGILRAAKKLFSSNREIRVQQMESLY